MSTNATHTSVDGEVSFRATPVELRLENTCQSPVLVDQGDGTAGPCRRPLWGGDGHVNMGDLTFEHAMCSRCWHVHNAFHGPFITMKANPAAAKIDNEGLARLFITRGMDAAPLPDPRSMVPGSFPVWLEIA